ncbi:hypothetical protein [Terrisporobacter muris]|uniref:Uncharacterized protein n=1 Tax=Terrisporobacter muris TaxID=2963284 RepID=A0A9X2M8N6_9FIRM|nr:hypothetical protein [Terrisporobacter muris]MCR1821277.1 hypothetical protein [Terrisporobacter muris]
MKFYSYKSMDYLGGHKPLGSDEGRDMAIEFVRLMTSEKEMHKAVCFIKPLLEELQSIDSDDNILKGTIEGIEYAYEVDFTDKDSVHWYLADMRGNLGYVFSFNPYEIK